jgi:hypothetical protein
VRTLWGSEVEEAPPTVQYSHVMSSDDGVAKLTMHIVGRSPRPLPMA